MNPDDMVKEINERTKPVAYYRGVPIYVRDDMPENEAIFIKFKGSMADAKRWARRRLIDES